MLMSIHNPFRLYSLQVIFQPLSWEAVFAALFIFCPLNSIFTQVTSMEERPYFIPAKEVVLQDSTHCSYIEMGNGDTTLLFIHGLGSYSQAWKRQLTELSKRYRCIAIDLPGYGKSALQTEKISMFYYAEVVHALLKELNAKNPILVGHSMGAQVAVHTSALYPGDYLGLVLLAPAGIETFSKEAAVLLQSYYKANYFQSLTDSIIVENFNKNFHNLDRIPDYLVEDRIAIQKTREYPQFKTAIIQSVTAMLEAPSLPLFKNLSLPIRMVFGQNDQLIPNPYFHPESIQEYMINALRVYPEIEPVFWENTGHYIPLDQPEKTNALIIEFVNSLK